MISEDLNDRKYEIKIISVEKLQSRNRALSQKGL
jgi:hypothetical protein